MESSVSSPKIIWEGEASVPCDEIVEGVGGPSLFGSDFCLTQYCTVEVWQLPSRGNDVVISCVAADTEAEYATKLSRHEWAALGFPPLTDETPASTVAAACESLCRVLRIMSSGRLRIEAAQRAIYQGNAQLGSDQRYYKVHVWEAATAELQSSNHDYNSHRRALVVKAEPIDRRIMQPQQELVLRVESAILDTLEGFCTQAQQAHQGEHRGQGSTIAVTPEALCEELVAHLELDHRGSLGLNLSSKNSTNSSEDAALKTSLSSTKVAAAATVGSTTRRPLVANEATRARPKSAGAGRSKQSGDASEPKSFLRWRKRLPPKWRKDLDNALAHAYAPPLYATAPVRPIISSHRHRAHVHASKGGRAEEQQQEEEGVVHEHVSPRPKQGPLGEHSGDALFGAGDDLKGSPNLDASPHAPGSATAAQQRHTINFGYLRQELRGLSSWNAQTSAPPSVLRRELQRADLLTGGFIKPLQPTVSVLHSNQAKPRDDVGFGTSGGGGGAAGPSSQHKEGFDIEGGPPERVVFSSGQGLKMLRRRSSPSSSSNHQGLLDSCLHQNKGLSTTNQPPSKGRKKLPRPKSAPQRSNTHQQPSLRQSTPPASHPQEDEEEEGAAEDSPKRFPFHPQSLNQKNRNSNGPPSWTTDDILESRGPYLEHGVPSALVPGRGGSPDRIQPLGCGGEFDRVPQGRKSPSPSPDDKNTPDMPVTASNAAKDDEGDKNADFIAEDERDKDFIDENEGDATFMDEDERDKDFIAEDEKDADFIDENEGDATFIAEDERDKDFIAEDEKDADFIAEDARDSDFAVIAERHEGGGRVHVSLGAQGPEVVSLDIPSIHTKQRKKLKKKQKKPKKAGENINPAFEDIGPDRVYPKDHSRRHLGGSAVRVAQWRRLRRDRVSRATQAQHIGLAARVILKYQPGSAVPGPVRRSSASNTASSAAAAAATSAKHSATFEEATTAAAAAAAATTGPETAVSSSSSSRNPTVKGPILRHGEAQALRMPEAAKPGPWSRSSEAGHAWAANQGPPPLEEGGKSPSSPSSAYPRSPTRRPLEDKNARLRERQRSGKESLSSSTAALGPLSTSRKSVELVGVRAVAITGKWRHKAMHMGISRTTSQPPVPASET